MKENKPAEPPSSIGKEYRRGKNFRIPISNGIFEHYGRLKDARWLLDLFVDWTTREARMPDGSLDGIVLGGKPIRDEDTASAFGGQCSARTARRWRQRLAKFGYISQKRTPLGYMIHVKKSKKWVHHRPDGGKVIGQNWPIRPTQNGRSELPVVADQTGHNRQFRTTDRGRSNKDYAVQNTDIAVEKAASAAFSFLKTENEVAWRQIILVYQGNPRLLDVWTRLYSNGQDDEPLSVTMERCILECKKLDIRLAPPFFQVKRAVEAHEVESKPGLPLLRDPAEGLVPSR